jgi:hypothetical protein
MRIPEASRNAVVFLGREVSKGNVRETKFLGTGFFVSVQSKNPERKFIFLVTAQHVAEKLALGDWIMRINMKNGQFRDFRMTKDYKWWFHPTEKDSVDVAVGFVALPEDADCNVIPEKSFVDQKTIEDYGIGPGDEVYMTGLFTRAHGKMRNLPIARMGNLAISRPW